MSAQEAMWYEGHSAIWSSNGNAATAEASLCYAPAGGGSLTAAAAPMTVTTGSGFVIPLSINAYERPGAGDWKFGLCSVYSTSNIRFTYTSVTGLELTTG
jgi:hypothetical protein